MSFNSINSRNASTTPLSDSQLLGGNSSAQDTSSSSPVSGPQFSVFFERMMHPSFATDPHGSNVNPSSANALGLNGAGASSLDSHALLGQASPNSLGGLPLTNFLGGADLSALSGTSTFGDLINSSSHSLASTGSLGPDNSSSTLSNSRDSNGWSPRPSARSSSPARDTHPTSNHPASRSNSPGHPRDRSVSSNGSQDHSDRAQQHSANAAGTSETKSTNAHEHLQRRESSSIGQNAGASAGVTKSSNPSASDPNAATDQASNTPNPTAPNATNTEANTTNTEANATNTEANSTSSTASSDVHSDKLTLANLALNRQRLPSVPAPDPMASNAPTDPASAEAAPIDPNAVAAAATPELKTLALGDNSQIVTASNNAPSEKSLADFARSMGFDEGAISELFGPDANALMLNAAALQAAQMNPVALNPGNGMPAALTSNSTPAGLTLTTNVASLATLTLSANGNANTLTPTSAALLTSNTLGTTLNPLSHLPTHGLAPNIGLNTLTLASGQATLSPALSAGLQSATGAGLLSANVAMGTLTGTDAVSANANISVSDLDDMLAQAGVNTSAAKLNFSAAALAPGRLGSAMTGNATAPASTLSVLNMTGSELTSSAIDALHTAFNQLNGKGAFNTADPKAFDVAPGATSTLAGTDPSQAVVATLDLSGQSNHSGAGNHGFTGSTAASDPSVNQNPLNMADTYEKLSNQLASELSRRMNEQISQGQWKMKFALKPSSLGAVDVSLEMKDGKLAAVLQSDNALTQHLLQHGSQQLKDNLSVLGMNQTSVQIGQGSSGGASAGGQGAGSGAQNPFDNNSQNANSINDLTQASSTVADATITGNSNDSLLDTFA